MLIIEHHVVVVVVVVAITNSPCPCLGLVRNSKVSLLNIAIVNSMMGYPILTRRPRSSSWWFLFLLSTLAASGRSRRDTFLELRGHAC